MLLFLQEEKEEIAAETQVILVVAPLTLLLQSLGELVLVFHSKDIDCGPELPVPTWVTFFT